jgi:ubiquinone/menaquinone biosynthesis C-methylase UbiE
MTENPDPVNHSFSSGRMDVKLTGRLSGMIYLKCVEPLMKAMKSRIARWISESELSRGVDICCGIGTQSGIIQSISPKLSVKGLDINPNFIRFASKRFGNGSFICGDATRMPLKSSSLDFLIYSYALHDKPESLRKEMMSEAGRVLNDRGVLFLLDFEQPGKWLERLGFVFTTTIEFLAGWDHFRNGREFIRSNGLSGFITRYPLEKVRYHRIAAGHTGLVMAVLK